MMTTLDGKKITISSVRFAKDEILKTGIKSFEVLWEPTDGALHNIFQFYGMEPISGRGLAEKLLWVWHKRDIMSATDK